MKMSDNKKGIKDGINLATGAVVHRGEYVKNIIRQLGIKITSVAAAMQLSRNTLYNKFADPELNTEFIHRVGQIIKYDFSKKIADVQPIIYYAEEPLHAYTKNAEFARTEQRYIELMEKYNYIMELLARIALSKGDATVLEEVKQFIAKNSSEAKGK